MITETTAESLDRLKPLPRMKGFRPLTCPADPMVSSRLFQHGEESRLGLSVMFGGKAYLGSIALKQEGASRNIEANALADLLEEMVGLLRRAA